MYFWLVALKNCSNIFVFWFFSSRLLARSLLTSWHPSNSHLGVNKKRSWEKATILVKNCQNFIKLRTDKNYRKFTELRTDKNCRNFTEAWNWNWFCAFFVGTSSFIYIDLNKNCLSSIQNCGKDWRATHANYAC